MELSRGAAEDLIAPLKQQVTALETAVNELPPTTGQDREQAIAAVRKIAGRISGAADELNGALKNAT